MIPTRTARGGITRRNWLRAAALGAVGLNAHVTSACHSAARSGRLVVGTRTRMHEGFEQQTWLAAVDLEGGNALQIPLPLRGHSVIQNPVNPDIVVVLAQRSQRPMGQEMPLPGVDSCEVSLMEQRVTRVFRADEGHHFYGHGAYTADGSTLFTTENDFGRNGEGVLTVRDASSLQAIGRLPTHGVDPHELLLIQSGRVAVIANGGQRTHPDYPTIVLNEGSIESSVVWIDMRSGALLDRIRIDGSRYSLRHLAADDDGTLVVALQDGVPDVDSSHMPVAIRYRGGELRIASGDPALVERTRWHALSVALMKRPAVALVTHPTGECVTLWDVATAQLIRTIDLPIPTGVVVTPSGRHFLVSSADSRLYLVEPTASGAVTPLGSVEENVHWDSHLTNVRLAAPLV